MPPLRQLSIASSRHEQTRNSLRHDISVVLKCPRRTNKNGCTFSNPLLSVAQAISARHGRSRTGAAVETVQFGVRGRASGPFTLVHPRETCRSRKIAPERMDGTVFMRGTNRAPWMSHACFFLFTQQRRISMLPAINYVVGVEGFSPSGRVHPSPPCMGRPSSLSRATLTLPQFLE